MIKTCFDGFGLMITFVGLGGMAGTIESGKGSVPLAIVIMIFGCVLLGLGTLGDEIKESRSSSWDASYPSYLERRSKSRRNRIN